jgi:hypothetical protein
MTCQYDCSSTVVQPRLHRTSSRRTIVRRKSSWPRSGSSTSLAMCPPSPAFCCSERIRSITSPGRRLGIPHKSPQFVRVDTREFPEERKVTVQAQSDVGAGPLPRPGENGHVGYVDSEMRSYFMCLGVTRSRAAQGRRPCDPVTSFTRNPKTGQCRDV